MKPDLIGSMELAGLPSMGRRFRRYEQSCHEKTNHWPRVTSRPPEDYGEKQGPRDCVPDTMRSQGLDSPPSSLLGAEWEEHPWLRTNHQDYW